MELNNNDFCFLIPSYNRYDKLSNLLDNIKNIEGINVIVFDDASDDERYNNLTELYPEFLFIKNNKNNGKVNFNETIRELFNSALKTQFKYFITTADDMILCQNFMSNIQPLVSEYDICNLFTINGGSFGWGCTAYIDGCFISSYNGLKLITNIIPNKLTNTHGKSTGVWSQVTRYFCGRNNTEYKLKCLNYTLFQHDGNYDSKLHPGIRDKKPIIANNFYDYYFGDEIRVVSESETLNLASKKKSSDATSNGNVEPLPIIPTKKEVQSKPISNSQITSKPVKLHKPEQNNSISRTINDIALGKLRKSNLRFGKR
jgi:hypothetical protein